MELVRDTKEGGLGEPGRRSDWEGWYAIGCKGLRGGFYNSVRFQFVLFIRRGVLVS